MSEAEYGNARANGTAFPDCAVAPRATLHPGYNPNP
jgi:hypothetical protein